MGCYTACSGNFLPKSRDKSWLRNYHYSILCNPEEVSLLTVIFVYYFPLKFSEPVTINVICLKLYLNVAVSRTVLFSIDASDICAVVFRRHFRQRFLNIRYYAIYYVISRFQCWCLEANNRLGPETVQSHKLILALQRQKFPPFSRWWNYFQEDVALITVG